jgi:hypothetical protein
MDFSQVSLAVDGTSIPTLYDITIIVEIGDNYLLKVRRSVKDAISV